MPWILAAVIVFAALAVLALVVLRLWRRVKALAAEVGRAGEAIGTASLALEKAQAEGPLGRAPGPLAPRRG